MPAPAPAPAPASTAPEITSFNRVASIPILAYCIQQVSGTLSTNRYTSTPYSTAMGLSASAYKLSEPLQVQFRPWIESADGYANKAVDVVQDRFPATFQTKPEDVAGYVRDRRQSASEYIDKTLDEKVKTPAVTVVYGMDQRLTPIVDYLESTAVTRLNTAAPGETQYQVQRVYALSTNVTRQLYDYSNQTVIVQRASQTADSITALASTANTRIHALSDSLLAELQRLQSSLAATGVQASHELNDTITSLHHIITTPNLAVKDKVMRVGAEVDYRVRPVLSRLLGNAQRAAPTTVNDNANGHAH
ncbi:hypothetical protein C8F04DRAFT_975207 [Mycena alexandri]|uniref:Lipid droplet-associated perilipin protein n=1 Tax=Mycena alexandri TaxID=1745969 RepID=A0AAD6S2T1_9AGAR|nr:hypothetical protein C8F04DRAFT_975207 [Mycena alexandri]